MIPLIILGLLKQHPGAHGYELLALMEERHYQYIVNFTKGSFYYHLQQMEEKLWIEKVEMAHNQHNREAHHYVITELGQQKFEELMHKYGAKTEYVKLSFYAAMLFEAEYPAEQFQQLIQEQIAESKQKIALLEHSIEHNEELSAPFIKMLENSRAHHLVNVNWFESLLAEIKE
ncbi:PadR family transcriptional regulator [Isobaculum melis]|uniref:DNA-binding transcriptional regulator, PadR family n=1 Tax=Isobaculum melis TaxID=142588 RepID=A0A1H9Q4B2_9LACT|nr:helix-turn-helix transcriptional regulator [Isobaculum melis]SER54935.1 DNA-binding transcriptional regulator, PadR family [Isobaculum melis]